MKLIEDLSFFFVRYILHCCFLRSTLLLIAIHYLILFLKQGHRNTWNFNRTTFLKLRVWVEMAMFVLIIVFNVPLITIRFLDIAISISQIKFQVFLGIESLHIDYMLVIAFFLPESWRIGPRSVRLLTIRLIWIRLDIIHEVLPDHLLKFRIKVGLRLSFDVFVYYSFLFGDYVI